MDRIELMDQPLKHIPVIRVRPAHWALIWKGSLQSKGPISRYESLILGTAWTGRAAREYRLIQAPRARRHFDTKPRLRVSRFMLRSDPRVVTWTDDARRTYGAQKERQQV